MASIDFPNSPAVNDVFTAGNSSYRWTGTAWVSNNLAAISWESLTGKPATFPPSTHTHVVADTTGLQTALDGKQAIVSGVSSTEIGYLDGVTSAIQTQIDGKAATSHTHVVADTTGLQTALDGKAATSHTHAIADTTGLQTALDGKAATSHTHAISAVTSLQTSLDSKLTATVSSPASGQVISYNGSGWVNSAAPASGGMTLISDTTLAAGANTVTLSSIPQTYKKLEIEINQVGGVANPSTATMVFNGQTSSTYSWGHANLFASGGAIGSGAATFSYGVSQATGAILPGITSGSTSVTIPNYTSTTVYKNFQYFNFTAYIQSSANSGSGIWNSFAHGLSAINSIGFTFSSVGGSTVYRVKLWGVN